MSASSSTSLPSDPWLRGYQVREIVDRHTPHQMDYEVVGISLAGGGVGCLFVEGVNRFIKPLSKDSEAFTYLFAGVVGMVGSFWWATSSEAATMAQYRTLRETATRQPPHMVLRGVILNEILKHSNVDTQNEIILGMHPAQLRETISSIESTKDEAFKGLLQQRLSSADQHISEENIETRLQADETVLNPIYLKVLQQQNADEELSKTKECFGSSSAPIVSHYLGSMLEPNTFGKIDAFKNTIELQPLGTICDAYWKANMDAIQRFQASESRIQSRI